MLKTRIIIALLIVGGILCGSLAFMMPAPGLTGADAEAFRTSLSFFFMNTVFSLGAAGIYLLGLVGFTPAFRRTYYWICAGLVVQSIGAVVFAVSLYMGAFGTPPFIIMAEIPLAAGMIMNFVGFVKFARLLHAPTVLTKSWVVVAITLVVAAIAWLAPHYPAPGGDSDTLNNLAHSFQIIEVLFYFLAGIVVMRIRATASKVYRASLGWYTVGMIAAFIPTSLYLGINYFTYPAWLSIDTLTILIIIANFSTIISGYYFNKIAHGAVKIKSQGNGLVDAIILLASLVSRPSDINMGLDKLRAVTAMHKPDQPFTPQDTKTLEGVYHDIKNYLATKESLRTFTPHQLDDLVRERLNVAIP